MPTGERSILDFTIDQAEGVEITKYRAQFLEVFPRMLCPNLMSYSRAGLMTPPNGYPSRCYLVGDQLVSLEQ